MSTSTPSAPAPTISRRRLLTSGVGVAGIAVGAGGTTAGFRLRRAIPKKAAPAPPATATPSAAVRSFRSRPDLSPPRVQMTAVETPTTEAFFLTPNFGTKGGSGQQGLMILNGQGQLVWFQPLTGAFSNLQVQTYKGEPVLTWWQGTFNAAGFGQGTAIIADSHYKTIATIRGANGVAPDLHEFVLTPQGTALVTAYAPATADLRSVGGQSSGAIYSGIAQEIDVATGKLLFEWRSIDHVAVDETHATLASGPFDYFHINAIDVDPSDGNLLVSARNTWTVYKIDRSTGAVMWRLGGKRSDFAMGPGTSFEWQHDARAHGSGVLTVFDDGAAPAVEQYSRALQLAVDEQARTARLTRAIVHPARLLSQSQGNVQVLADGGVIVGWGSEPYFSHFDAAGTLVRDGRLPTNVESYRAFREPWTATPTGVPDIATEGDSVGGTTVYVSWNGDTEIATWQVLTGAAPGAVQDSGSVARSGFETAITVHPAGPYLAVRGLNRAGAEVGRSKVAKLGS